MIDHLSFQKVIYFLCHDQIAKQCIFCVPVHGIWDHYILECLNSNTNILRLFQVTACIISYFLGGVCEELRLVINTNVVIVRFQLSCSSFEFRGSWVSAAPMIVPSLVVLLPQLLLISGLFAQFSVVLGRFGS